MPPARPPVRVLLVVAGLAVGLDLVEAAARLLVGPPLGPSDRVAFFSPGLWVLRDGAVRYRPDATLRTVAIYGERVEYDVRFRTNDLGFVDERDYADGPPPGTTARYAFVGDSFTAGVHGGGRPWPARLRERARRGGRAVEIYNLGVSSASFVQFAPLLRSVSGEIGFEHVVFLFITDDLFRPAWRPWEGGGRIVVCPLELTDAACALRESRLRALPSPDATQEQLVALAARSASQRASSSWSGWLAGRSVVGSRLAGWWRARERASRADLRIDLGAWLAGLGRAFGHLEVAFLHVPERHETRLGRHAARPGPQIEAAGFRYVSLLDACELERDDYFEIDGHLDASGYDELVRCVGRVLGVLPDDPRDARRGPAADRDS